MGKSVYFTFVYLFLICFKCIIANYYMEYAYQNDENLNFAIDNLNAIYTMRKLFLFLVVLFLSFQQLTLAAIKEMTSTPDSVYLFSFATSGDDGRSGLRFAWSMDK